MKDFIKTPALVNDYAAGFAAATSTPNGAR